MPDRAEHSDFVNEFETALDRFLIVGEGSKKSLQDLPPPPPLDPQNPRDHLIYFIKASPQERLQLGIEKESTWEVLSKNLKDPAVQKTLTVEIEKAYALHDPLDKLKPLLESIKRSDFQEDFAQNQASARTAFTTFNLLGRYETASLIAAAFRISPSWEKDAIQAVAQEHIRNEATDESLALMGYYQFSGEDILKAHGMVTLRKIGNRETSYQKVPPELSFDVVLPCLPEYIRSFLEKAEIGSWQKFQEFFQNDNTLIPHLFPGILTFNTGQDFTPPIILVTLSELITSRNNGLLDIETVRLRERGNNIEEINYKLEDPRIIDIIAKELLALYGEENILLQELELEEFVRAAKYFSTRNVLHYTRGYGERQLADLDQVITLSKVATELCGLTPERFYGNIVHEVSNDSASYEWNGQDYRAEHLLSHVSEYLLGKINITLKAIRQIEQTTGCSVFTEQFQKSDDIFTSWKALRAFAGITLALEKGLLQEACKLLGQESDARLNNFVTTIRDGHNPDMFKLAQMFAAPVEFFVTTDKEAPADIQAALSAGNIFTSTVDKDGNPDISFSRQVVLDLIRGRFDPHCVIAPLSITYEIPYHEIYPIPSINEELKEALGSRSERNHKTRISPQRLYNHTNNLLKKHGLSVKAVVEGEEVPLEAIDPLRNLIYDPQMGMPRPQRDAQRFKMTIWPKSNPQGIADCDDIPSCMHFGSGKQILYWLSTTNAQLSLTQIYNDGTEKVVAASLVQRVANVGVNLIDILQTTDYDYLRVEASLFDSNLSIPPSRVLSFDDIRISPHYSDPKKVALVKRLYEDFSATYLERRSTPDRLESAKVVVGGFDSDYFEGVLPPSENHFIPEMATFTNDTTPVYRIGEDTVAALTIVRILTPNHQFANYRKEIQWGETARDSASNELSGSDGDSSFQPEDVLARARQSENFVLQYIQLSALVRKLTVNRLSGPPSES